ncbi:MAG: hypothetical protein MRQ07_01760 [Candidatus Midichloria sp.]|nr:hypothetical protein [Candidatus Midichloria sp.]
MPIPISEEKNPLKLFEIACSNPAPKMLEQFLLMVKHLYQYQIFQLILDFTATKISEKLLSFKLYDQRFFDLDAGNCKTIYGNSINQLFNQIRSRNKYQITIKKLSYDVIIHEIAHMIEKEVIINLQEFMGLISDDLREAPTSIGLKQVVEQIFFTELKLYPEDQKPSELFARYFQILCLSKEISGLSSTGGYKLEQALTHFSNTTTWVNSVCKFNIISITDSQISTLSSQFLKKAEAVEHKWSEQKATSIHGPGPKKWGNIITSIKSDYFK